MLMLKFTQQSLPISKKSLKNCRKYFFLVYYEVYCNNLDNIFPSFDISFCRIGHFLKTCDSYTFYTAIQ